MADEKSGEQNLVRVKADSTGVDLAIGRAAPGVLSRLLPTKFRLRRAIDNTISDRIVDKVARGEQLNEAEHAFAEDILSEQAKKYVRLAAVEERAQQLLEVKAMPLLTAETKDGEAAPSPPTSNDWINRFREDASLVADNLIREIYARVLATEERRPGAFAMRTLGALRYMDRDVATAFGKIQEVLVNGDMVPQQSRTDDALKSAGLDHSTMLMLSDAGLVNSAAHSECSIEGKRVFLMLNGQQRVLSVRRMDDSSFTIKLQVHLLTPAGMQLARIAECEKEGKVFLALVSWLKPNLGDSEITVADLPSPFWRGPAEKLQWTLLDREAAIKPLKIPPQ